MSIKKFIYTLGKIIYNYEINIGDVKSRLTIDYLGKL